jgi:hypothetical protein
MVADRGQVVQCQPSLIMEETQSCGRYVFQRATLLAALASPGSLRKTEPLRATLVSSDGRWVSRRVSKRRNFGLHIRLARGWPREYLNEVE